MTPHVDIWHADQNSKVYFVHVALALLSIFSHLVNCFMCSTHNTKSMDVNQAWKASTCSATLKKFPEFYVTWRFVTVFTRAYHRPLSWARWVHSTPTHSVPLVSILIQWNRHLRFLLRKWIWTQNGGKSYMKVIWHWGNWLGIIQIEC
jgi:hypothetical protein